jgi:hypothetical protein
LTEYEKKLEEVFSTNFNVLEKNPLKNNISLLNNILLKCRPFISDQTYFQMKGSHRNKTAYGILKLHKENVPLRPIVSCQNCISSGLEEFLYPIIKQLLPFAKYSVDSTKSFVEKLKQSRENFDPTTDNLISLDIKDMYNNVSVNEVIALTVTKLYNQKQKYLKKIFEKIPPKNIFEYLLKSAVMSFSNFESKIVFFLTNSRFSHGIKIISYSGQFICSFRRK